MNKTAHFLVSALIFATSLSCGTKQSPKSGQEGSADGPLMVGSKGDFVSNHKGRPLDNLREWFHQDPRQDFQQGISSELAYKTMGKEIRRGKTVVVAVIDSGVDIHHEDLRGQIWQNTQEMDGRPGVDDDGNGYVDDFHGWNFLGGPAGNVDFENIEQTRLCRQFGQRVEKGERLSKEEQKTHKALQRAVAKAMGEAKMRLAEMEEQLEKFEANEAILRANHLLKKKDEVSFAKLSGLFDQANLLGPEVADALKTLKDLVGKVQSKQRLQKRVKYAEAEIKYHHNLDYDPRHIIGDDPKDLADKFYGNNDVVALDPTHGTHVAGIIAAKRRNRLGMDGIAEKVKIMVIRAIPHGDERDKDVVNAVRYAVDNGAHIINMSFCKNFSTHKAAVDGAFQYAASKGVLVVHAAGNDSLNLDQGKIYPNRLMLATPGLELNNWLEVGASTIKLGVDLVASFSNYGKGSVDVFAPGKDIYSTVPGNAYEYLNGTSMATPVVSGIAATLLSRFPQLSALAVREILMESATRYDDSLNVRLPGSVKADSLVWFTSLSRTGGIVNMKKAFEKMKDQPKSFDSP